MKIIESSIIPFKPYKSINLFGLVFHRRSASPMTQTDINHEAIHTAQQQELLFVGFYLWYVIEWLVRLVMYRDQSRAYRSILFEQEAYGHQSEVDYLAHRKWWAWARS